MTQWSPILASSDKIAISAREAVNAIVNSLMAKDYEPRRQQRVEHPTYEEALLYGYLALAQNDFDWAIRATECLNQAIDEAAQQFRALGLFGGVSGLGWTVEHLSQFLNQIFVLAEGQTSRDAATGEAGAEGDPELEEDANAQIDEAILRNLRHFNSSSPYDLISGLVGYGVYFLERLPKDTAVQGIQLVFEQLEALAEQTNTGTTWHSGPDLLPAWQRAECPNGYYNLGVAHGIPGVIHFLSEVSALTIVSRQRSHELLEAAVNWLISQRRPAGSLSTFSAWIVPGEEPLDCRLAWCYGDIGILSVLLQAARRAGREDWQNFANDLLDHCLAWPPVKSGVGDAALCHGAVGVAHIFNRIYHSENDPRCLNAALAWLDLALTMREPGAGVGGFCSLTKPDPYGPIVWEANPNFLDGAIGVALALLAALTPVAPAWDRMLLLSGRACPSPTGKATALSDLWAGII